MNTAGRQRTPRRGGAWRAPVNKVCSCWHQSSLLVPTLVCSCASSNEGLNTLHWVIRTPLSRVLWSGQENILHHLGAHVEFIRRVSKCRSNSMLSFPKVLVLRLSSEDKWHIKTLSRHLRVNDTALEDRTWPCHLSLLGKRNVGSVFLHRGLAVRWDWNKVLRRFKAFGRATLPSVAGRLLDLA